MLLEYNELHKLPELKVMDGQNLEEKEERLKETKSAEER